MNESEANTFFQQREQLGTEAHRKQLGVTEVGYAEILRLAMNEGYPESATDDRGRGLRSGKFQMG